MKISRRRLQSLIREELEGTEKVFTAEEPASALCEALTLFLEEEGDLVANNAFEIWMGSTESGEPLVPARYEDVDDFARLGTQKVIEILSSDPSFQYAVQRILETVLNSSID